MMMGFSVLIGLIFIAQQMFSVTKLLYFSFLNNSTTRGLMVSDAVFLNCLVYIGLQFCILYLVDYLSWTNFGKYGNRSIQTYPHNI